MTFPISPGGGGAAAPRGPAPPAGAPPGGGSGASVQPAPRRDDAARARRDWGERAEAWGYPWQSLLGSGAVLAFGTDAPVEPIDPWPGIAMAVLRRHLGWGGDVPAFGPD